MGCYISVISLVYLKFITRISQVYFGHISGILQMYFGYTLSKSQSYTRDISDISKVYIKCMSGRSWVYIKYISDISHDIAQVYLKYIAKLSSVMFSTSQIELRLALLKLYSHPTHPVKYILATSRLPWMLKLRKQIFKYGRNMYSSIA